MKFIDILYPKNDGIARVTINRPEVYNAIRGVTTAEMSEALVDASNDPDIRVVVIAGTGSNAFCSGRDQSEDPTTSEYSGSSELSVNELIRTMPQLVIAMVDGFAIGSGNILAYMCDFTIASERSTFGQQYSPQRAFEMGLVNSVVHHDQLEEEVARYCSLIKNNSPVILQLEKLTFNEIGDYSKRKESPAGQFIPDYNRSDEATERRLAFLERRPIDPSKNLPYVKILPNDRT